MSPIQAIKQLIEKASYLSPDKVALVQDAYDFSARAHEGQLCCSGAPYNEFDDYIANPKPNGYKSLHTTVMCMGTTPLEVQIRTYEVHRTAEYGLAAHWRYKEGDKGDNRFEERVSWLRQLIDSHREDSGAKESLGSFKTDILNDRVFVHTPRGEIKDLPRGSTPLDLAYLVSTELGHSCVGSKVNGQLTPLNYQPNNGDVVEIMTVKGGKGPSLDWLKPELGYIKTSNAREEIRRWFKMLKRNEDTSN